VVPRPKEKTVVSSKWIYTTKCVVDGSIERFRNDALLLGTRNLAKIRWDFPKSRKVCCRNIEEVRYVVL
jgi:hypothetical protein